MERHCIDELLRRIDGRKVKDEACVGSQGGEWRGVKGKRGSSMLGKSKQCIERQTVKSDGREEC